MKPASRDIFERLDAAKSFGLRFWHSFSESQCMMWASTLCYATLLAVVPLMAVTLAVASAFPVYETWMDRIQGYIFENFVPGTSEVIREYLNRFVTRASRMPVVGVLFLVVSAVLLLFNIDRALNRIWHVSKPRALGSRLLSYWMVLTLGPVLMTASVAVTSYLAASPILAPARKTDVANWLLPLAPFAISTLAFFIVYLIVPNKRVAWRHALSGAVVAGVLFEAAKTGFAFYVTHFPAYEAVYGAFAAIPLFLVWVYLSWLVTLAGATVAAMLGRGPDIESHDEAGRRPDLSDTYRLVAHLWDAQRQGRGLTFESLREMEPELRETALQHVVDRLAGADIVHEADDERWYLSRDVSDTTLLQLLRAVPVALPDPDRLGDGSPREAALAKALRELDEPLEAAFDRPLRDFFEGRQPAKS